MFFLFFSLFLCLFLFNLLFSLSLSFFFFFWPLKAGVQIKLLAVFMKNTMIDMSLGINFISALTKSKKKPQFLQGANIIYAT